MSDNKSLFKVMLIDYIDNQFAEMMNKIDKVVEAAAVDDCWDKEKPYLLIKSAALALFEDKAADISDVGAYTKKVRKDANNIKRIR